LVKCEENLFAAFKKLRDLRSFPVKNKCTQRGDYPFIYFDKKA